LGKGRVAQQADGQAIKRGESACIITYGMGVYWALEASKHFAGQIEIVDLRSLFPLDEELVYETVKRHGRCLVLTEEQQGHSFVESLAGRIQQQCFRWLDAPVHVLGALDLPAVPINLVLEASMLAGSGKTRLALDALMNY
jgi:2-oxoisovalerate dehydrogenase E1 component